MKAKEKEGVRRLPGGKKLFKAYEDWFRNNIGVKVLHHRDGGFTVKNEMVGK